jgi:Cys-tRNA(Pro)/Cys-tRNA(Cys) deacylase
MRGRSWAARSIADIDSIDAMPTGATPAILLVARAGIPHDILEYALPDRHGRERDARPDYGPEAAAALRLPPATVGKTLIALVDGAPVAAVVSVDRQLDLRALATACGGRRAELADPAVAERLSGSVVGGISPLAPRRPMTVVVDASVIGHERVCVSAGRRGVQLRLAPADLVRLCTAKIADIAR